MFLLVESPWLLAATLTVAGFLLREVTAALLQLAVQDAWAALRRRMRRQRRLGRN